MKLFLYLLGILLLSKVGFIFTAEKERPFFQATKQRPYHLSVGAVLFDQKGRIACHHFKEIFGYKDIYILMRESMENDETVSMTLLRGLKEEFGAEGKPIAFLGCLSGFLPEPVPFEKTTLYVACEMTEWDPAKRDPNDPEATSTIEWLSPSKLISIMQKQGARFKRIDVDESEMIKRALPYINPSPTQKLDGLPVQTIKSHQPKAK
jgi:hypothetical protein